MKNTEEGTHVLVDYCGASGGDFLRYLISLHEGFEKITVQWHGLYSSGNRYSLEGEDRVERWKDIKSLLEIDPAGPYRPKDGRGGCAAIGGWDDSQTWKQTEFPFPRVKCDPEKKMDFSVLAEAIKLKLPKEDLLKIYYSEFKKEMPNEDKYRQCYKLRNALRNDHGHSLVGTTFIETDKVTLYRRHRRQRRQKDVYGWQKLQGRPTIEVFKWDYSDYEVFRQTNHKIIFIIVNPFSKYKDFYLRRHELWAGRRKDYNKDSHEETWKRNYVKNNYPKHKLNYELEMYDLLDKDDQTYYDLIKFLDVKPINGWKKVIDEYKQWVKME